MAGDLISRKIQAFDYCEPGLTHLVPPTNREDKALKYSHNTRLCPHLGDGEDTTKQLNLKAALSKDHAVNTREWYESGNEQGENLIRQACTSRDKKVLHWQRNLRHEIDNLTSAFQSAADCVRLLLQTIEHFDRIFRISQETLSQRLQISPNEGPKDPINCSFEEEMTVNRTADEQMTTLMEQLRNYQSRIQDVRNCLISDAEAKSMNLTVSKSCQHYDILLSFPLVIEEKSRDQKLQYDSEEKWEKDVSCRVKDSVALRTECAELCRTAENAVAANNSKMAAAWKRSQNLLCEEIEKNEYSVFSTKQKLHTTLNDITAAEQRLAGMSSDYDVQARVQRLTFWRQQRLTGKPEPEYIDDQPVKSLATEAKNIGNRMQLLREDIQNTEELLKSLNEMKADLIKELSMLSKNLFIDRDSCLGLRRTVVVDGSDGKNV